MSNTDKIDNAALRDYLVGRFNFDEIRNFCGDVLSRSSAHNLTLRSFDADDIGGATKLVFTANLIAYLDRRSALGVLLDVISGTDAYQNDPFPNGPPPRPTRNAAPQKQGGTPATLDIDLSQWPKRKIRVLLELSLNETLLIRLCDDNPDLTPARNEFAPGMGLNDKFQKLMDYCELNMLNDVLVNGVRAINPRRFAQVASQS